MGKKYTSITLPTEMVRIIDQFIVGRGYSSRAEYVKYLIRKDIGGRFNEQ